MGKEAVETGSSEVDGRKLRSPRFAAQRCEESETFRGTSATAGFIMLCDSMIATCKPNFFVMTTQHSGQGTDKSRCSIVCKPLFLLILG